MGTRDMVTMCGVSMLLLPLLSLTVASPVLQPNLEVSVPEGRSLGDPSQDEKGLGVALLAGWGIYNLVEYLLRTTPPASGVTTPGPGVPTATPDTTAQSQSGLFGWWPNNGGFLGFGLFGKTTTATATTTTTFTTTMTTKTTTTPTATTTTTTPTTTASPPPTTTKCGGLIGGGLLFC